MKLPLAALVLCASFAPATAQAAPGPGVMASQTCSLCHSNAPGATALRDAQNRGVAPYDLWRSSMMANSARDPLWRAVVSAEVAAVPAAQLEIESTCLSCHTPMADAIGLDDHGTGSLMHVLDCEETLGTMARDGVSCTICHGISPDGLGTEESFSAGFTLDPHRRLYGPHREPFAMPMRNRTTFTPTHGSHILDSALCGSCHTLETEALDAEGHAVGQTFLEQAPYLEWRNSVFQDERGTPGPLAATCQDCHLPTDDVDGQTITTRIARNPGGRDFPPVAPRAPVGRHVLVGGNTLVLGMLRDHAAELGVEAPAAALQATIDATRDQLRHRTAQIALENVARDDALLTFEVAVQNLTGHKLPSAHPTRRAWLRVVVLDAAGVLLFGSGRIDAEGRLVGADGAPLPSELAGGPLEPHRDVVRAPDEVATYQAVMADSEGNPTHTLVRGASWAIDDRLLPLGWSAEHPEAERTAPVGVKGDANFVGGSDRVRYEVVVPRGVDVTIEATLLYQTLNARWADELFRWDTPEVARFRRYWEAADLTPETLAAARWPQ